MSSSIPHFRTLIKGAGVVFSGNLILQFLSFVYHIPVVRLLGPEKYGIVSLVYTIINMIGPLCLLGLNSGLTFFISGIDYKTELSEIKDILYSAMVVILPTSLIVMVAVFIFSQMYVSSVYQFDKIEILLAIMSLSIPFTSLHLFIESIFRATKLPDKVYKTKISVQLLALAVIPTILMLSGSNIILLVAARSILIVLGFFISLYLFFKTIMGWNEFWNRKQRISYVKKLINFSWPLLFTAYFQILSKQIDILFIGYFLKESDVGYYRPAVILSNMLWIVPMSIQFMLFPIMREIHSTNQVEELNLFSKRVFKLLIYIVLPLPCFIFFFPEEIIHLLYGSDFNTTILPLLILTAGFICTSFQMVPRHNLLLHMKTKTDMCIVVLMIILNILLNYFLIPRFGIAGAALATSLSFLFRSFCFLMISKIVTKNLNISPKAILYFVICAAYVSFTFLYDFSFAQKVFLFMAFVLSIVLFVVALERRDMQKLIPLLLNRNLSIK